MIEELGISRLVDAEALSTRRLGLASAHMGLHQLSVGSLLSLLQQDPLLKPPRSAHIGNWEDIAHGRAGAMDFNQAICTWNAGYPLIYAFTQTEAEGSLSGDWVYVPGSLISRGQRQILPLFTWDGSGFVRRSRDRPLFCPFVMAEVHHELVPLIELHWERMQTILGFHFLLEAAVMMKHTTEVKEILSLLLEIAGTGTNPQIRFQDVVSQAATIDGAVTVCTVQRRGKGYLVDDCFFPSTNCLVDHILVPFEAAARPRQFFARIAKMPARLPLISSGLVRILSAIFTANYPSVGITGTRVTRPFNLHLHWGARDMAGFPPRRMGYFTSHAKMRRLGKVCKVLVEHFIDIDPILFALLPAAVFMLCPTSFHPGDQNLISELFTLVLDTTSSELGLEPKVAQHKIEELTGAWKIKHRGAVSPYFLNRFRAGSGVLHPGDLPPESKPIEPRGFRSLSFRQACTIVGALVDSMTTSEV